MALVKCTKEIKSHVTSKIDELFSGRINKAYELRGMTESQVANEVYAKIHTPDRIKVMLETAADINKEFKILFDVREFGFTAQVEGVNRKIQINWNVARPALRDFASSYNAPIVEGFTPETKQVILEAAKRRKAVIDERETFKKSFNEAFEQVKSVNELIKLWPAVIELLPNGTMDRVNRKTGPRIKQGELFDAAALNVQLLKAKVAK